MKQKSGRVGPLHLWVGLSRVKKIRSVSLVSGTISMNSSLQESSVSMVDPRLHTVHAGFRQTDRRAGGRAGRRTDRRTDGLTEKNSLLPLSSHATKMHVHCSCCQQYAWAYPRHCIVSLI